MATQWDTPPTVTDNIRVKILWDLKSQTYQPEKGVIDMNKKRKVVIGIAIPPDSHIWNKEHKMIEKYQGVLEQVQQRGKMKSKAIPRVIKTPRAVTFKLCE